MHDAVDIEPISYVYDGEYIDMRTAAGSKFDAFRHHPWVAFEVDEVEGPFSWRSVVVHGTVYRLELTGSAADAAAYKRSLARLRTINPEAFAAGDPTPFRDIVVRLFVERMTGRAAGAARQPAKRKRGARRRTPPSSR